MFPWNLAKSAEEMFSRWALKRLCKFLLKKKLGQFVLGDIDLDQLDVQLIEGTIQLTDLALNAEFLNQKLSAASVIIKEGSVGSLSVKMPWKGKGFEVEVDELEIVLAPLRTENTLTIQDESFGSAEKNHQHQELGSRHDATESSVKPTSVHEGVKTIAKLVKWILTSFHVTIKKLIIAFDPFSEEDKKMTGAKSTLVFRISEIECGTCVSDCGNSDTNPKIESFLGMNELTNFVKFHGAVLELLQIENVDNQMNLGNATERTLGGLSCVSSPSHVTIPILSGRIGGFSGNLKFSVPWKDGSFDICKVDANVFIDHIYLKLQLSTIKQFLILWEAYANLNKEGSSYHDKLIDSAAITSGNNFPSCGGFPLDFSSSTLHESLNEGLLHHSHLIADWLPFSVKDSREENIGVGELDFGASVDQFFECLDEMRSSQSAFGNSGMWNWKNSVFSAITAASSLASGSLHIPSDQKHVETNLKATFAGLSITLSFHDDDQTKLLYQRINGSSEQHFVAAECRDIILVTQVSLQEMKFHGTVEYMEVSDYISYKENDTDFSFLIQHLQANVQDALPPLSVSFNDHDTDLVNDSAFSNFLLGNSVDATKVTLLKTSGITSCQVNVMTTSQDENSKLSNSFSLKLSPFVLWVNFPLISTLLDFLKKIEKYVVLNEEKNVFSSKAFQKNHGTCEKEVERNPVHVKTLTAKRFLGDIFISNARVILCFPFESGQSMRNYSSWEQFIALDFSSPPDLDKGVSQGCDPESNLRKQYLTAAKALHLNAGNLDVFLITPILEGAKVYFDKMLTQKFLAHNILSIMNNRSCSPVITMFWQEGHVTGPWIAKKARSLARDESRSRYKFVGKGYEFTSASAVKDMKESYSQTRQEMILSSTLVLHFSLHLVKIHLNSFQYKGVSCLLNQLIKEFSNVACDAADTVKQVSPSQRSIVVDCDCVEISMNPDTKDNIKSSIQKELPGSWYHLKLEVQKFELMSVSDVGGIKDANFFWLAHGEGKLSGCITGVPDHAFLLVSCSNTTLKRGNGEGSNVLSTRLAGSNIIHMLDSESGHGYITINLRCMTFVAVGGRLDWLDTISSFFAPTEQVTEKTVQRENKKESSGVTFFLILVDVGVSYEPYLNNLLVSSELHGLKSSCSISNQGLGEKYVACLLAASSLTLSNATMGDIIKDDYRIAVQDVGLLIKGLSKPECLGGTYSVEHLAKIGYVKVAREALIEATMKTNCSSGLLWEAEFSKCHIFMETCPDTTSGMIRLAAQLQQLFAPELEESVLHLQARWNNVQQAQESELCDNEASSPHSSVDKETDACLVGLMNEICEDAFLSEKNQNLKYDSTEVNVCNPPDQTIPMEISFQSHETLNSYCPDIPFFTAPELKRSEVLSTPECSYPEFIEEYCLSELRSLSELSLCRPMLRDSSKSRNEDLGEEINGWYGDMPLTIVENHIDESCIGEQSVEEDLSSSESRKIFNFGKAAGCVLFTNIDMSWRMYAGSDWNGSVENGKQTIKFCKRDVNACLELALSGIQVQYDVYLDGGLCTSRLSLSVQDLHLYDKSKDAPWKLMIGYYNSKDHPRESSSKAFKMELEAIRPDPSTPLEEYRLHASFLPILLHLHQQQLDFLINFFGNKSSSMDQLSSHLQSTDNLKSFPIACRSLAGHTVVEEALLPYFQKFDVRPSVVRVDYSPSHVDLAALRGGKYVELVNLVPWKGVELQLKHVHAVGIYGWSNVCETVVGEWLEDISHNQIHKILGGLPTIRSLVAVGAGASKLVSLPVESYRKDRRILKGMQRGTIAFLRSISLEAVALGVHLAAGAHDILVQAECIVTSSPSVNVRSKAKANARSNQPKDAQEGIQKAYESLSDGLGKSTSALVRTPLKKYQRGAGAGSALVTAVRALPTAAIVPASACASALHYTFLGFRNSLDPDRKKESMEKYLGPTESWEHN